MLILPSKRLALPKKRMALPRSQRGFLNLPGMFMANQGGFSVSNSLSLNGTDEYMNRAIGTPTNAKKYTYSAWVYLDNFTTAHSLYSAGPNDTNRDSNHINTPADLVLIQRRGGTKVSQVDTVATLSATTWAHIMYSYDSTQATSTDRIKFYINNGGVEAVSTGNAIDINRDAYVLTSGQTFHVGKNSDANQNYYDGLITHVAFIDGQALTPSSFGEDNGGLWYAKDLSGLTFGNNGFWLKFENSANLGEDSSGNGNDLTLYNIDATNQSTAVPSGV